MASLRRQTIFNILRIALCVGALWIVARGVTVNDVATLAADGSQVTGTATSEGFEKLLPSGETVTLNLGSIATDEDGVPAIAYGLKSTWKRSVKVFLLVAVLFQVPIVLLQAWRFQWMLRVQEIIVGYWSCLKLSYAGNFLNFATPLGSNAGDVFKGLFLSMHAHQKKTEVFTTIVLDRLVGLGGLLLVAGAITTFAAADGPLVHLRPFVLTTMGIAIAAALAYLSPPLRKHLVPRSWIARLGLLELAQRIDRAALAFARHRPAVIWCLVLTIILQGLAVTAYFAVALALALDANAGHFFEFAAYFYSGTLIQALPGPPQGLGTVELAYRYFFASFGSASQIVCMALAIRLVVLTGSLPGLLVTITGAYKPAAQPDQSEPTTHLLATDPSRLDSPASSPIQS